MEALLVFLFLSFIVGDLFGTGILTLPVLIVFFAVLALTGFL